MQGAGLRGRARGGVQHPAQHLPVRGPAVGARPLAAGRADHGLRRAAGEGALPAGGAVPGGARARSWTSTCTRRSWRCASPAPRRCTPPSATWWARPSRGRPGWCPPARLQLPPGVPRDGRPRSALERRRHPGRWSMPAAAARGRRRQRRAFARLGRGPAAAAPARRAARRRAARIPAPAEPARAGQRSSRGLRYIGQLHRTYLVCEAPGELVLVDQHAAHERVAFPRLRRAHRARAVARQRLLFPLRGRAGRGGRSAAAQPEAAQVLARPGLRGRTASASAGWCCGRCPSC